MTIIRSVKVGPIGNVNYEISGSEFEESPYSVWSLIDISPLGASDSRRITERSPGQDGDTDLDMVLDPRVITMILQVIPNNLHPYYAVREVINSLFRAKKQTTYVDITFDNGLTYRIDTKTTGGIDLPFNLPSTGYIKFPIKMRAANPTFYWPEIVTVNFGIVGGSSPFTVPTFVPTFFGYVTLNQTITINYVGTYKDYPLITILGPITNPRIENIATGMVLDLPGVIIAAGEIYTIDLRYGRKLVYKNGDPADNRISEMSDDSNLAHFAIVPDPDAQSGMNEFHVTGSSISGDTQIYVQYYVRFDGI